MLFYTPRTLHTVQACVLWTQQVYDQKTSCYERFMREYCMKLATMEDAERSKYTSILIVMLLNSNRIMTFPTYNSKSSKILARWNLGKWGLTPMWTYTLTPLYCVGEWSPLRFKSRLCHTQVSLLLGLFIFQQAAMPLLYGSPNLIIIREVPIHKNEKLEMLTIHECCTLQTN